MINLANRAGMLVLFMIFAIPSFAQSSGCEKILEKGLYEYVNIDRKLELDKSFQKYLSSKEFKEHLKNDKWGGSIIVPVDDEFVTLGANASDEEIDKFQKSVREDTKFSLSLKDYESIIKTTPNVKLAEVYSDCLARGYERAWSIRTEFTEDDGEFKIKYSPLSHKDAMPILKAYNVRNGTNVETELKLDKPVELFSSIRFTRDPEKDSVLHFVTDHGEAITATIPKDVPLSVLEYTLDADRDFLEGESFRIPPLSQPGKAGRASRYSVSITGLSDGEPHIKNNPYPQKLADGGCGGCARFYSQVEVYLNGKRIGDATNNLTPKLGTNGYFVNFQWKSEEKFSDPLTLTFKVVNSKYSYVLDCKDDKGERREPGCNDKKQPAIDRDPNPATTTRFSRGLKIVLTPIK
jgi:hypothetical protein